MRGGPADHLFVVGAVQIDVAGARVAAVATIDAFLEPIEGQDAGQDEIVDARLAAPPLAGPLARDEHRAERRLLADPAADRVPARRRAERALGAADAVPRGRHRPRGDRLSAFEPSGDLTLGVDHEQPVGQARRRALAGEAVARKIERAGGREFVERGRHARTLPQRLRAALPPLLRIPGEILGTGKSSCGPIVSCRTYQ